MPHRQTEYLKAQSGTGEVSESLVLSAQLNEVGDAAGDMTTTATMVVGDLFDGTISSFSDTDWVEVDLTSGVNYVIKAWGTTGSLTGLADPIVTIYDSTGTPVATNDNANSPGNLFSLLEFTPAAGGTYYIEVDGVGTSTGNYTLQLADDWFTVDQAVTQLTEFGWGVPTDIHFAEQTGDTMTVNITGLTAEGQQLALWALEAWSIATGITFVTSVSAGADILFDDNFAGAYAGPDSYYPSTGEILQSSVNIGTGWLATYGTTIDSYSFTTYMHEIGHALGLGHGGVYNGTATFPDDAHYMNDSTQMSIMSYFFPSENTFVWGDSSMPVTPATADYAAMAFLYGLTAGAYTGDTTWGANSNVGGYLGTIFGYIFDGDTIDPTIYAGGPIALTIFDTGGHDTLDLSTLTTAQVVNLTSGFPSDVAGSIGNLMISEDTVIEDLLLGSGSDLAHGNDANNFIDGGDGFDTLTGALGNDTISGVGGNDSIEGGGGSDRLLGGRGHDTIIGGTENDRLFGQGGNDYMEGGDHNDRLTGNAGNDTLDGGRGADKLYGNVGNDLLIGATGSDKLYGGDGDDSLDGGHKNDLLYGDADNDTLNGGLGNDTMDGGTGNDVFIFANNSGNDVIFNFEELNPLEDIDLSAVSAITDYADLMANHAFTSGTDVLIDMLNGNSILIKDVNLSDLDVDDFIF